MFKQFKRFTLLMSSVLLSTSLLPAMQPAQASASVDVARIAAPLSISPSASTGREAALATASAVTVTVPIIAKNWPWASFVGVETNALLSTGSVLVQRAQEMGLRWARLNGRISWRNLQPVEGGPIDWSQLAGFEDELRALKSAGVEPVVIVDDHPYWATIPNPRTDGKPTSCAAIRPEKFGAFAAFLQQLVGRYSKGEFNVRHWELGNEVDVDPNLLLPNEVFGCWGDRNDEYYGGRRYGEMLKAVVPAIRQVDPSVRIWMGGLLLDKPSTTTPGLGKPEKFFEGVLVAGGAPYFDILPYHNYLNFNSQPQYDHDSDPNLSFDWYGLGGRTVGKARYLRSVMARYGVNKPLFLNESGFVCPNDDYESQPYCVPQPTPAFFQQQSNHLVRMSMRALSEGVIGFMWYTLDGPGWRNGALLNPDGSPRPVFNTYKHLQKILSNTRYVGKTSYGGGIEGYRFSDGGAREVQVMWVFAGSAVASVPQARFVAAYNRDGAPLAPAVNGGNVDVTVGYEPVFIELKP